MSAPDRSGNALTVRAARWPDYSGFDFFSLAQASCAENFRLGVDARRSWVKQLMVMRRTPVFIPAVTPNQCAEDHLRVTPFCKDRHCSAQHAVCTLRSFCRLIPFFTRNPPDCQPTFQCYSALIAALAISSCLGHSPDKTENPWSSSEPCPAPSVHFVTRPWPSNRLRSSVSGGGVTGKIAISSFMGVRRLENAIRTFLRPIRPGFTSKRGFPLQHSFVSSIGFESTPKSPSNVARLMRACRLCYQATRCGIYRQPLLIAPQLSYDTKDASLSIPHSRACRILLADLPEHTARLICGRSWLKSPLPCPRSQHPKHALYVFGPEDGSIDQALVEPRRCGGLTYPPFGLHESGCEGVNVLLLLMIAWPKFGPRPWQRCAYSQQPRLPTNSVR